MLDGVRERLLDQPVHRALELRRVATRRISTLVGEIDLRVDHDALGGRRALDEARDARGGAVGVQGPPAAAR